MFNNEQDIFAANEHPNVLLGGSDVERENLAALLTRQINPQKVFHLDLMGKGVPEHYASFPVEQATNINEAAQMILDIINAPVHHAERWLVHVEDASLFLGNKKDSFIKSNIWDEFEHLLALTRSYNVVVILSISVSHFDDVIAPNYFGYKFIAGVPESPNGYSIPVKAPRFTPISNAPWNIAPLGLGAASKEVSIDFKLTAHAMIVGNAGSGKTVLTRNIAEQCLATGWSVMGIDVRRVELNYLEGRSGVIDLATDLKSSVEALRSVESTVKSRYKAMEDAGVNFFEALAVRLKPVLVLVDEAYMLLAHCEVKTEGDRAENELRSEASRILRNITHLGRAAGVHVVLATQRPDASVFSPEFKQSLACRISVGKLDTIATHLTFDTGEREEASKLGQLRSAPLGRCYIQTYGMGEDFQMYGSILTLSRGASEG